METVLKQIEELNAKDEKFASALEKWVREYSILNTGFDLDTCPFKGDNELMYSFDKVDRSTDVEKQWEKHKLAIEELGLESNNRHKKMAFTKTKKTLFKMFEKLGFDNDADGFGGVEARWLFQWLENGRPMYEEFWSETTQETRRLYREQLKAMRFKK